MEDRNLELFASCLSGFEHLLADELKQLGARRVRPLGGGVSFFSDVQGALRVCLWSRLASRITLVVARINASTADKLYDGVRNLVWEEVIAPGASMAVQAHGMNDQLRNTRFTALKVKDGICDRLREVSGNRPDIDASTPDAIIDVRIRDKRATVSFDLTGESLYRRAYLAQDEGSDASLECALAAGLLALAGKNLSFTAGCVDPVCGNGSVVIEAASLACDLAPGLSRARWGFMGWALFDEDVWACLIDDADSRFECGLESVVGPGALDGSASAQPDISRVCFVGACTSSPSIARARSRARRAGLRQAVSIELGDAQSVPKLVERVAQATHQMDKARANRFDARKVDSNSFLIASVLTDGVLSQSEARSQAEAGAFSSAAVSAPQESVFAAVGGEGIEARFGLQPSVKTVFGSGRVETEVLLFDQAPVDPVIAVVPDSSGGAEHKVEVLEKTSEQFALRLHRVAKERRKWARRSGVTCYRVYDADLPDYAVAIDLYTGAGQALGNTYLSIAEYAPPSSVDPVRAARRFDDILTLAPVVLDIRPDHVFTKVRRRDKGGSQYRSSERRSYVTQVEESKHLLEVDLSGYLDTGLFLDHRVTRELIASKACGKRFLNLFAYTGVATVHAAAAGAVSTCTVDLSQTYLDWARRNMELNGLTGDEHSFERADVMPWITSCRRSPRRFDLIFVDPPTFSNSKAMGKRTWDVQRDHVELLIGVTRLFADGGEAIFSCNLRNFKPDQEMLSKYGVSIEEITAQTIPHDFERNPRIHKCYLVRRA